MARNHNKTYLRPALATAVGLGLLATGCAASSSSGSARSPGVCETGRTNSPDYQPYPGATDNRKTWGGLIAKISGLEGSGVVGIFTSWRGAASSGQWIESDIDAPDRLQAQHDDLLLSVGDGEVQFSIRFIADVGSAACAGQLPHVLFDRKPSGNFKKMSGQGLEPTWNTDTAPTDTNTTADAHQLGPFSDRPLEDGLLAA